MRLDLIFSLRNIYINSNLNPLTEFTSSSRSTKFKDILPWNISQMITNSILILSKLIWSLSQIRSSCQFYSLHLLFFSWKWLHELLFCNMLLMVGFPKTIFLIPPVILLMMLYVMFVIWRENVGALFSKKAFFIKSALSGQYRTLP